MRLRPRSRGQALVELALILPVFLLLLCGAIDLGRVFYSQITINDAAREGALEAARNPGSFLANTPCTTANQNANRIMCRTLNEAKGGFVTVAPADVARTCTTVSCPPATPALGDLVSVHVQGTFTLITPFVGVILGNQTLVLGATASAQMNVTPTNATVAPPVAFFTASPLSGNAPLTVAVTDGSTGSPTSWSWDFDNGQTSNVQNPVFPTYTNPGVFTITLTVSNSGGTRSFARDISVSLAPPAPPVANFTANPPSGAAPLTVTFADTSTGTPTSWAWNFGDSTTSTAKNPPPHLYTNIGNFTVSLTVTNAGGTDTKTFVVSTGQTCAAPVAAFNVSPTSGKKKQASFVVDDTSSNMATAGCNNVWSWNFGDGSGNSSLQAPPGHVYNSAGTYTITLGVSNSAGTSTATRTVTVTP